mgnify:CR=1 FL=1
MMDLMSLFLLLLLAAMGWFWFDSLRALEIARNAGKHTCNITGVQFLDDTVASIALALVRNESGRRVLRRTYRFEFSDTGNTRLEGRLVLLGAKVESVTMEPYQCRKANSESEAKAIEPSARLFINPDRRDKAVPASLL